MTAAVMPRTSPTIVTLLEPRWRLKLATATRGECSCVHADTFADAGRAIRAGRVNAVVVGAGMAKAAGPANVAAFVAECAGIQTVAAVTGWNGDSEHGLLSLGRCGVSDAIDLSAAGGSEALLGLIGEPNYRVQMQIIRAIAKSIGRGRDEAREFLETVVRLAPNTRSMAELIDKTGFGMRGTLSERWSRSSLPSVRRYLAETRLLYALAILEAPGGSIKKVVARLGYSSRGAFSSSVRSLMRMTVSDWRKHYTLERMIARYCSELVASCRTRFRDLSALAPYKPEGLDLDTSEWNECDDTIADEDDDDGTRSYEDDPFGNQLLNGTLEPDVLLAVQYARRDLSEDEAFDVLTRAREDTAFDDVLTHVMNIYELYGEFNSDHEDDVEDEELAEEME